MSSSLSDVLPRRSGRRVDGRRARSKLGRFWPRVDSALDSPASGRKPLKLAMRGKLEFRGMLEPLAGDDESSVIVD